MFSDWQSYLVLKVIVKTTLHQHCASIANVSWSLEDDSASGLSFFLSSSPGMSTFSQLICKLCKWSGSEFNTKSFFGSFFAFGIDIKGYWLARRLCALPIFAARLRSRMFAHVRTPFRTICFASEQGCTRPVWWIWRTRSWPQSQLAAFASFGHDQKILACIKIGRPVLPKAVLKIRKLTKIHRLGVSLLNYTPRYMRRLILVTRT